MHCRVRNSCLGAGHGIIGTMRAGGEYTYAGLSASLCRGALERPWLPLSMWKAFFQRSLIIGVRATPTVFLMADRKSVV